MTHNLPLKFKISSILLCKLLVLTSLFIIANVAAAQSFDRIERERTKDILRNVKNEIKKNYYDSSFHGIDLDARFKIAEDKLDEAKSLGQAFGIIAQAVIDLNDSHTTFYPPARAAKFDYGWEMQMIGSKCYVTAVKPNSDAEAKGLKRGDEIISVEGFRPNRKEMWKMLYYYYALSPRPGFQLVVQSPGNNPRELNIASKVTPLKRVMNLSDTFDWNEIRREIEDRDDSEFHRFQTINNIVVWKFPNFVFDPQQVDTIIKNRVNGRSALVLDLRGNPGGLVVTLKQLVGYFFKKDIKIADLKGRKEMEPQQAKSKGGNVFNGKVVVLVDSRSASAAEIFARVMQLEKRGVVVGDQSSGSVMQSRSFSQRHGADNLIFYGMSITNADVIMSDGKSLEHTGVTPDEIILPTAEDIAADRDPVLARAIEIAGAKVSPEDAGKFFPIKWKK